MGSLVTLPGPLEDWLAARNWDFSSVDLLAIMTVLAYDLVLSMDNSLTIAAIVSRFSFLERIMALFLGLVGAVTLRAIFLEFAADFSGYEALGLPIVKFVGSVGLMIFGAVLFVGLLHERGHIEGRTNFLSAIGAIIFADLLFSADNVAGALAISSRYEILLIGTAASMAMLFVATTINIYLIRRFPGLRPASFIIMIAIGSLMLFEISDPVNSKFEHVVGFRVPHYDAPTLIKLAVIFGIAGLGMIFGGSRSSSRARTS